MEKLYPSRGMAHNKGRVMVKQQPPENMDYRNKSVLGYERPQ